MAQDRSDGGRYPRTSLQNETQASNSSRFLANFSAARASSPHISNCHNSSSWAAFHIVSASAAPSSKAKDATTDPVKETIGDKPASMNGEWLRTAERSLSHVTSGCGACMMPLTIARKSGG